MPAPSGNVAAPAASAANCMKLRRPMPDVVDAIEGVIVPYMLCSSLAAVKLFGWSAT
jgi:hypothetical protein